MTVAIPAPLVCAGGGVPQVCARHGEPAAHHNRVVFRSYTPRWAYLLLPFGVLPFAIVAGILQKRVKAPAWPFCPRCDRLRYGRMLTGIGVVVLAVLTIVVLAALIPKDASYGGPVVLMFVVALIVGLGIIGNSARSAIASGYVSRDGNTVRVRRPHPRFGEHVAAAQQWAAQQQYPQQGYPQPQHGQQPYPHLQYPQKQYPQQQQPYGLGGATPS
jgi:hypothetical protein